MVQIWVEGQLEISSDQGLYYSMIWFKFGLKASGKVLKIRDHFSMVCFKSEFKASGKEPQIRDLIIHWYCLNLG